MDGRDRVPDPRRQDLRRQAAGVHPAVGHAGLVDAGGAARAGAAFGAGVADKGASAKPTEATVQGPFYWVGAPELPLGSDIGKGMPGEPAYYSGRSPTRRPADRALLLDVWSGDGEGVYDMQKDGDAGMQLRARFHTDDEGRYRFWSIKPTFYPVPDDGPVGDMLRAMGRHPNRPGHIHMMVSAPATAADDAPVRRRQSVPRFGRGVRRARQPDRALRAACARQGARRPHDGQALPQRELRLRARSRSLRPAR